MMSETFFEICTNNGYYAAVPVIYLALFFWTRFPLVFLILTLLFTPLYLCLPFDILNSGDLFRLVDHKQILARRDGCSHYYRIGHLAVVLLLLPFLIVTESGLWLGRKLQLIQPWQGY